MKVTMILILVILTRIAYTVSLSEVFLRSMDAWYRATKEVLDQRRGENINLLLLCTREMVMRRKDTKILTNKREISKIMLSMKLYLTDCFSCFVVEMKKKFL